ncbi:efflux RND transporter permease subunit [Winogradskyella maritima]|nr:efflux RND transporter permease subunit [Winogradskyella maritima]
MDTKAMAERLRTILLNNPQITQVELGNVPDSRPILKFHVAISKNTIFPRASGDIIRQSSNDVPAGAVQTRSGEILLRMQERKQWAKEYGNITIVSSDTGAKVALKDIATITDGFEEVGSTANSIKRIMWNLEYLELATSPRLK